MASLRRCRSVKEVGEWMERHGLTPSENRNFGLVNPVHSPTSLHYQSGKYGTIAKDNQGDLALDVNDRDVRDTFFLRLKRGQWKVWRPTDEREALDVLYKRIARVARRKRWPMYEAFFNGYGYKASYGWDINRPISGHETHGHWAWSRFSW